MMGCKVSPATAAGSGVGLIGDSRSKPHHNRKKNQWRTGRTLSAEGSHYGPPFNPFALCTDQPTAGPTQTLLWREERKKAPVDLAVASGNGRARIQCC